MQTKQIALIPAYQPGEQLVPLAKRLSQAGFAVVVVDDGSGPDYVPVFDAARPYGTVLSYADNRGKGDALKFGLYYLHTVCSVHDIIVTMDADGQHTVEDALNLVRMAARRPEALVLGVRSFGKGTPLRSRMGNAAASIAFRLASGARLGDTQTGLRAFTALLLPFMLAVEGHRYEYEMNVLLEAARSGVPLCQVPIATIYLDGNKSSHFHTVRDSARVFGNLLKFAGSSLTGFVIDYSLYGLLVWLLGGLGTAVSVPVANVAARVVSAGSNFAINKHFVFKNKDSALVTGLQYFALAACILAGNTVLLSFLVNGLGANKYAAKIVTELTFFTLSWLGQRFWIFGKKQKKSASAPLQPALTGKEKAA